MASRVRTRGLLCAQPLGSKGVQDEGWLTGTHRKTRGAQAGGGLPAGSLKLTLQEGRPLRAAPQPTRVGVGGDRTPQGACGDS